MTQNTQHQQLHKKNHTTQYHKEFSVSYLKKPNISTNIADIWFTTNPGRIYMQYNCDDTDDLVANLREQTDQIFGKDRVMFIPLIGQSALCIESITEDLEHSDLIQELHHNSKQNIIIQNIQDRIYNILQKTSK